MNKIYNVAQHYAPEDFKYKEIVLVQRLNSQMQFRYENAVSVYNIYVTDKDGMYRVESINRRSMGRTEQVNRLEAIVESFEERARRSGL